MATETQETTMVTEREAVERERAAYARGAQDRMRVETPNVSEAPVVYVGYGESLRDAVRGAEYHYPPPKVTRRRKLMDPHLHGVWWYVRGEGDNASVYHEIVRPDDVRPLLTATARRIALWADLLANPTEEVTP